MYLLDNFVEQKFLHNISILVNQYGIGESLSPVAAFTRFLTTSEYFCEEIFSLYTEHYKRNFIILEILTDKQGLDTVRQALSLVRNHISETNIKLTISDLVNLYLSHIYITTIIAPEIIPPSGLRLTNPR